MEPIQVPAIPEKFMSQLARDFRAALSYVSFYPLNSIFVTQSASVLLEDFQRILCSAKPLYIHIREEKIYANDYPLLRLDELVSLFQDQKIHSVEITKDISLSEIIDWLQFIIYHFEEINHEFKSTNDSNDRHFLKTDIEPNLTLREVLEKIAKENHHFST